MPISLIPKRKERKKLSLDASLIRENKAVVIAMIPLITVIGIYVGMSVYIGFLEGGIEDIKRESQEIQAQRDTEAEEEVIKFDQRMERISLLLDSHVHSSKLFDFIEDNTHPRVQFTDFSFEALDNLVTMSGLTASYLTLGEQLIALQQKEQISSLTVSGVDLIKSGQVGFSVSFEVAESLYK